MLVEVKFIISNEVCNPLLNTSTKNKSGSKDNITISNKFYLSNEEIAIIIKKIIFTLNLRHLFLKAPFLKKKSTLTKYTFSGTAVFYIINILCNDKMLFIN